MLYYQPSQRLTWKYSTGTGQLTVMATITIDLYSNEYLTSAFTKVGGKILITLSVTPTGDPSPVTIPVDVDMIAANLSKDQVRDLIKAGIEYTVITTIYKNGKPEGEVKNITSSTSDIELVP